MPLPAQANKKAPIRGAFFNACLSGCLLCTCLLCAHIALAQPPECRPDRIDEQVEIAEVYDGDTVRLTDGRHVRLIGINTPERAHDDHAAEPLADEARQSLVALLKSTQRVGLRYGREKHDHYGRTLAQLFIDDQLNVQAAMVADGYAAVIAFPPNLQGQDCLWQQERLARQQRRGRWQLAMYRPLDVARLSADTRGFRIIKGRLLRVHRTAKSIWLDLDGGMALRIAAADRPYFTKLDLDGLVGRTIIARGWIYRRNGELRMRLRHPNNLAE